MLGQVRQLIGALLACALLGACDPPVPATRSDGTPVVEGERAAPIETEKTADSAEPPFTVEARVLGDNGLEDPQISLDLRAQNGFHINLDYPTHFVVSDESQGIEFEKKRVDLRPGLTTEPCSKEPEYACSAVAALPLKRTNDGPWALHGEVKFSVCADELCLIERAPVQFASTR